MTSIAIQPDNSPTHHEPVCAAATVPITNAGTSPTTKVNPLFNQYLTIIVVKTSLHPIFATYTHGFNPLWRLQYKGEKSEKKIFCRRAMGGAIFVTVRPLQPFGATQ